MAMNLTVAGPETRTETSVEETTTLAELLKQQGYGDKLAKASVMIDGQTLGNDALSKTLKEVGAISGSTVAVCIKLQNA